MSAKRNETLKKRYQVYRRLGYDSVTARVLSQRKLDVSQIEISDRTGNIKQNTQTKTFIEQTMKEWKRRDAIDNYRNRMNEIRNDTTYTRHGMLTHDKRYKGETGKIVSIIKNENKLSNDQAYYFYYFMNENNMTYKQAKKELLSNKDFELYDKNKRGRK